MRAATEEKERNKIVEDRRRIAEKAAADKRRVEREAEKKRQRESALAKKREKESKKKEVSCLIVFAVFDCSMLVTFLTCRHLFLSPLTPPQDKELKKRSSGLDDGDGIWGADANCSFGVSINWCMMEVCLQLSCQL